MLNFQVDIYYHWTCCLKLNRCFRFTTSNIRKRSYDLDIENFCIGLKSFVWVRRTRHLCHYLLCLLQLPQDFSVLCVCACMVLFLLFGEEIMLKVDSTCLIMAENIILFIWFSADCWFQQFGFLQKRCSHQFAVS